ncbi:WD repeat-containing protein 89 isoform X2 [Hyposmocoma kahamanoa]|uniref:WD repeat-containing protein 89 isoform X2 n=1 Tax=Hyposmocoma kahamanoa TaxID=1477025 RepID=UPI000E6D64E2|nr:WD repeat-containing protein 89 isoform X2 [Hyposmocoma kahamanoa]
MAEIVDTEEMDRDTVDPKILNQQFSQNYNLLTETAVSLKKSYINKIHGTKSLRIAASQVDGTIEVYELQRAALNRICRLSGHRKALTEIVFSPREDNLLYSCGEDGLLKLWDTRSSGSCVQEYKNEEEQLVRPYSCMDVSCNGRVLCAGTQLVEHDAYLVFWDNRMTKPLGGYWNSHTDEITQVKFHKEKVEILISGALDGLLNIYNILEKTEDDALVFSLNVENSVERLSWMDERQVACITQSNELQVWNSDTGDLVKNYNRDKVARAIKRSRGDDCYLVDTFTSIDETTVLLAGSYSGNGDILRSVTITDKKLKPHCNFTRNIQE